MRIEPFLWHPDFFRALRAHYHHSMSEILSVVGDGPISGLSIITNFGSSLFFSLTTSSNGFLLATAGTGGARRERRLVNLLWSFKISHFSKFHEACCSSEVLQIMLHRFNFKIYLSSFPKPEMHRFPLVLSSSISGRKNIE